VIATVDLLVLGIYTSATQVGVYAVAYQGYTALQNVGTASATVLTPLFVSLQTAGRSTAIAHFAKRVIPQVTFLAGTGLGVVAPFTTLLVVGVFGNAFRDAAQPLVILLIPATLLVMANLQAPVILLYEDTRDVGRINVVAAAINVILDFLLIGPAGLRGTGAAIATTLATLAIVIGYTGIVTRRAGSASPARLLLLLAPLLLGTLCGVRTTEWLSAVFAAGGVLVVALALVVCGLVFDRGDEEYLRRLGLPAPLRRMLLGSVLVSR
jgi:O-antigen/teichoic acid export membrane protein